MESGPPCLTAPERCFLGDRLRREDFKPGHSVVRQGDMADTLYMVESGRALGHARRRSHPVRLVGNFSRGGGYCYS